MRRTILSALSVIAVLVPASSAVAAPGAEAVAAKRGGVFAQFAMKASNGLTARVVTSGNLVDLEVAGHDQFVGYRVKGTVTSRRVVARFGSLGRISVRFKPLGRGVPGPVHEGVFVGTIKFTGERGYVRINATKAVGAIGLQGRAAPRASRSLDLGAGSSRAAAERETATLTATSGPRLFRVAAFREPNGSGKALYAALVHEQNGPIEIGRGALVVAPVSSFPFDHASGTATATPPAPFSGSATLGTRPDGSKSWEGSLSVALLGADPVTLAGPDFQAKLLREFDD
jgi:hypothetical protein